MLQTELCGLDPPEGAAGRPDGERAACRFHPVVGQFHVGHIQPPVTSPFGHGRVAFVRAQVLAFDLPLFAAAALRLAFVAL